MKLYGYHEIRGSKKADQGDVVVMRLYAAGDDRNWCGFEYTYVYYLFVADIWIRRGRLLSRLDVEV